MASFTLRIAVVMVTTAVLCFATDTATAQSPKVISTNLKGFTVPFEIDNSNGKFIEVQLYTSTDLGKTWRFFDKADINDSGFPFTSDGDGEYWFALKTLDRDRQLVPSGSIYRPELKIIVDTQQPNIEINIDADAAGRVITSWQIKDKGLDFDSFNILHRGISPQGVTEKWSTVEYKPTSSHSPENFSDRIAWWPKSLHKRIEVKIEIADQAGNKVVDSGSVSLPALNRSRSNSGTTRSKLDQASGGSWTKQAVTSQAKTQKPKNVVCENGVCRIVDHAKQNVTQSQPAQVARRVGSPAEFIEPPVPAGFQPSSNRLAHRPTNRPANNNAILWNGEASSWTAQNRASQSTTGSANNAAAATPPKNVLGLSSRFDNVPVKKRAAAPPTPTNRTQKSTSETGDFVISQSTTFGSGRATQKSAPNNQSFEAVKQTSPSQPPREQFTATQPPAQQPFQQASAPRTFIPPANVASSQQLSVNTRRFNLNYDIQAIDPSGVGKVVLWTTQNDGASWTAMAVDPDNVSPFPVEVKSEGTFGFKVAINSRDGITGKPPVSGDKPDVLVQVDLTDPKIKLTSAPYGSGADIGKLIIHWDAFDSHMKPRPIKLAYSPAADGPWTTIQDRLRNSGSYAWKVPAHVPQEIFLRIEADDIAGNTGIYQLTAPIDISGLVPRGRILSVDPIR